MATPDTRGPGSAHPRYKANRDTESSPATAPVHTLDRTSAPDIQGRLSAVGESSSLKLPEREPPSSSVPIHVVNSLPHTLIEASLPGEMIQKPLQANPTELYVEDHSQNGRSQVGEPAGSKARVGEVKIIVKPAVKESGTDSTPKIDIVNAGREERTKVGESSHPRESAPTKKGQVGKPPTATADSGSGMGRDGGNNNNLRTGGPDEEDEPEDRKGDQDKKKQGEKTEGHPILTAHTVSNFVDEQQLYPNPINRPKEVIPTHEPLNDNEMSNLLSAIGNHEGIALLLIAMAYEEHSSGVDQTRVTLTQRGLSTMIATRLLPDAHTAFGKSTLVDWCYDSLVAYGLINEIPGEKRMYTINEKGWNGVALAGLLLQYSEALSADISLKEIWGASQSKSSLLHDQETGEEFRLRAPLMRLRLFRELLAHKEPLSLPDLVSAFRTKYPEEFSETHLQERIISHLNTLAETGIISLTIENGRDRLSRYALRADKDRPDDPPPPCNPNTNWAVPVIEIIRSFSTSGIPDRDQIYEMLITQYPTLLEHTTPRNLRISITNIINNLANEGYMGNPFVDPIWQIIQEVGVGVSFHRDDIRDALIQRNLPMMGIIESAASDPQLVKTLLQNISLTLRHLEREGYIDHIEKRDKIRQIGLTDFQRQMLAGFIAIIDSFKETDTDIVNKGLDIARSIDRDSQRFTNLWKKAKKHSSYNIPPEQTRARIRGLVEANPGITAQSVWQLLKEEHNQHMSNSRVKEYLQELEKKEIILSEASGSSGKKKYFIIDNDTS